MRLDSNSLQISPKSIVEDACASYSTLEKLNARVKPAIDDLTRTTDFFSHYRLNLFNKVCPFWNDESGFCGNIGCAVETLDNEEDIPEVWRAKELSKLEGPLAKHPGKAASAEKRPLKGELGEDVGESCVFEYDDECDDRDYCVPEDESASSKGDYVSLLKNPEKFTGYGGDGAHQVWDAIYRENCFSKSSFPRSANLGMSTWPQGAAVQDFKQMMNAAGRQAQLEQQRLEHPNTPFVASTGYEIDDECLEKRVFHRVVSGMHASISTHLCWDYLNQSTGEWQPNLSCYVDRLEKHPERVSNLYFNYALVTRAVAKLGPHLGKDSRYKFCTGDPSEDAATRAKVQKVTQRASMVPQIFDETLMFVNGEGPSLKEDFRNRFRNISRLMDCVGCDKCRLWGKLQTNGYGTALKVLFEFDNNSDDIAVLKRTELVALFNTYARLSESLMAIGKFRQMSNEQRQEQIFKESQRVAGNIEEPAVESSDDPSKSYPYYVVEVEEEPEEEYSETMIEFIKMRQDRSTGRGIVEQIKFELRLFVLATRLVLDGWVKAPIAAYHLIRYELYRLYRAWLGFPLVPRRFKLQWPDLNRQDL